MAGFYPGLFTNLRIAGMSGTVWLSVLLSTVAFFNQSA